MGLLFVGVLKYMILMICRQQNVFISENSMVIMVNYGILVLIIVFRIDSLVQKFIVGGRFVSDIMMNSISSVNYGLFFDKFLRLVIFFVLQFLCVNSKMMLKVLSVVSMQVIVQNIDVLQVCVVKFGLLELMFDIKFSSRKFMCEIVEQFSRCLKLV